MKVLHVPMSIPIENTPIIRKREKREKNMWLSRYSLVSRSKVFIRISSGHDHPRAQNFPVVIGRLNMRLTFPRASPFIVA